MSCAFSSYYAYVFINICFKILKNIRSRSSSDLFFSCVYIRDLYCDFIAYKYSWTLLLMMISSFFCIFLIGKDGSKVTTVVATPGQGPDRPQEVSYSDTKVIGNGSFGVVFQAKLCDTGELVAIKKVLQDKRFKVWWCEAFGGGLAHLWRLVLVAEI